MTYWQKFRIYQPFNPIAKSNYFLPAVPLTRVHTKILNFPRFTLCPLSLYMYPRALKIGNNSSDICLFYKHLFSMIIFVGLSFTKVLQFIIHVWCPFKRFHAVFSALLIQPHFGPSFLPVTFCFLTKSAPRMPDKIGLLSSAL